MDNIILKQSVHNPPIYSKDDYLSATFTIKKQNIGMLNKISNLFFGDGKEEEEVPFMLFKQNTNAKFYDNELYYSIDDIVRCGKQICATEEMKMYDINPNRFALNNIHISKNYTIGNKLFKHHYPIFRENSEGVITSYIDFLWAKKYNGNVDKYIGSRKNSQYYIRVDDAGVDYLAFSIAKLKKENGLHYFEILYSPSLITIEELLCFICKSFDADKYV